MVDMCVRKYQIINLLRVETEVTVHAVGFEALTLVHTAVEEYFKSAFGDYQVFAAGYLLGGTHKFYLHRTVVFLFDVV